MPGNDFSKIWLKKTLPPVLEHTTKARATGSRRKSPSFENGESRPLNRFLSRRAGLRKCPEMPFFRGLSKKGIISRMKPLPAHGRGGPGVAGSVFPGAGKRWMPDFLRPFFATHRGQRHSTG